MIELTVNGIKHKVDVVPEMPLLWALRDELGITSPKYGCGVAQCGACTVHVDGVAMRSCVTPVDSVEGRRITTIEGLAENGVLTKVQQAWLANEVPQCGYCINGWIMTAASFLEKKKKPTDAEIKQALEGIKCRCGTHVSIMKAVKRAATMMG